ncbi:RNA exonuclease 4 [Schistosoma japonicum]|nr:RNA exonuclease 4 [Schistosoma japonicum]
MKKTSLYVNSISETNNSTILSPIALDCEMVGVGPENSNALGRISIVGYAGEVLCNITVKPEGEICDYRTSWSGLREEDMLHAMPYPYVRKQVESISIQNAEHCSIEDARASMAIYRLVKNMWEADLLKTSQ